MGGANFRIRLEEPYIPNVIQKLDFFKITGHNCFFFLVSINFVLDLALFTLAKLKIAWDAVFLKGRVDSILLTSSRVICFVKN